MVIGGFSDSIPIYMVSAAFLGVFFALQSGTFESIVYDTVLEETGDSAAFERTIGRVRVVESVALVASALVGGVIAQIAPLQITYFLTAPLLIISAVVLLRFREPRLHKAEEETSLREQIRTTYRTILSGGQIRLVVLLTIAGSLLMQGVLEFGALWLVALLVPPFLYGPHWAGLTGALGVGGVLGSRSWITRRWGIWLVGAGLVLCGVVLVLSRDALVVVGVQVLLILLAVAVSIPVTRSLHDSIPSSIRAGVASGVGTLTWLAFVPFALIVGTVSESSGIDKAGWLFVAIGIVAAVLMLVVLPRARPQPSAEAAVPVPEPSVDAAAFTPDQFCRLTRPNGRAIGPSRQRPGRRRDCRWTARNVGAGAPGDRDLPPRLRQVMVLRDVEGRSAQEVEEALDMSRTEQREMLQRRAAWSGRASRAIWMRQRPTDD